MSRIFWDTNLFIYLLEGSGEPVRLTRYLLNRMFERKDELLTSTLTVGEVLVKPAQLLGADAAERFERFFDSPGVNVIPFDRVAARIYSEVRRDTAIRPPDAIQLSCAAAAGTNLFVTNDERLSRKQVRGIDFVLALRQVAI